MDVYRLWMTLRLAGWRRPWIVATSLLLVTGCFAGGFTHDEVARVASPDGVVDAVLVEIDGGATVSFGYAVHLVRRKRNPWRGSEVAFLYGSMRSPQAWGANLRWESASTLVVEFLSARSAGLEPSPFEVAGREIEVKLVDGVTDAHAPPGGMLYNLQARLHDRDQR
jgi:hypothetical protein